MNKKTNEELQALVNKATSGDKKALETLVTSMQDIIMKLPAASPHRLTRAMRHSVGGVSSPASLRSALASTRQAAGNVPSYDSSI